MKNINTKAKSKKNIILVYGLAGSGKSTLIHYVTKRIKNTILLKKYSTREIREYEKHENDIVDNHFITEKEFNLLNVDCYHIKQGIAYGVCYKELDEILDLGKYAIISSPSSILRQINKDYQGQVINILVKSTIEECRKRISLQKMSEEQRLLRMKFWDESKYYEEEFNFDFIINNHSTLQAYLKTIEFNLIKYFHQSLIK